MFVALIILNGSSYCLLVAGIFYAHALHIHGFDTPVWSVNAPTAVEVISSGKGRNRSFISGPQTIFLNDMLITEKCLIGTGMSYSDRQAHDTGIQSHINRAPSRPIGYKTGLTESIEVAETPFAETAENHGTPSGNLFFIAMAKAIREFVQDESNCLVNALPWFEQKIKAARCLFPKEREELRQYLK